PGFAAGALSQQAAVALVGDDSEMHAHRVEDQVHRQILLREIADEVDRRRLPRLLAILTRSSTVFALPDSMMSASALRKRRSWPGRLLRNGESLGALEDLPDSAGEGGSPVGISGSLAGMERFLAGWQS
ncbi:MAG: hypothetical protein M3463_16925, partial [Verrucomicrobiota bacterium]|nr:hypothetical protein [Verrucomicrobiota bacterium]